MCTKQTITKQLIVEHECSPLYKKMEADRNPIFIWGCGALAIQVYNFCKNFGIKIEGCFINVPDPKAKLGELNVWTLEDLIKEYPKFSVIIGHSNYAMGSVFLRSFKNIAETYCIASCCYGLRNQISTEFIHANTELMNSFYNNLQDEKSRQCLKSYFESRINDKAEYMFPYFDLGTSYYLNDVVILTEEEILLDVGACVGNAIWPFIDAVKGKYKKIIALEPDTENYHALLQNISSRNVQNIITRKVCAYCKNGEVKFSGTKEFGGITEAAEYYQTYPAIAIDSLCRELGPDSSPSIIKINFPVSVSEILRGAKNLIKSKRPKLIIRAGFDEHVLLKTYETIKKINPVYQIYLRYTVGIPQGLTIFAI